MSASTYLRGFPRRSAYESARADEIRAQLFEMLGGACEECGAQAPLEIDHPWGRDWKPRKLSKYRRNLRYLKEAQAGLVRLLCADCNKRIPPRREAASVTVENAPC